MNEIPVFFKGRRGVMAKSDVRKDGLEEAPRTLGEQQADRPSQARDRELLDRKAALERRWEVLNTEFFSYRNARDLAYQREIAREMDAIETELNQLRSLLGQAGRRMNSSANDGVQKTERGASALNTLLRTPTVRKSGEQPEPWVTSTMTRTQTPIK